TPPSARTKTRIQLAGSLGKNGRIEGVTLLTQVSPAIQRAVLQDVTSWEFRPATTDGAPVDVDVVLEIPFSLPTALAQNP
ncbi:MAG TPA: energy transducer TonB, partial [Blastocatellia bacterium]|nr:energy transducer TonB [Blastocatellia bacterium]